MQTPPNVANHRAPTLLISKIGDHKLAVRFWNIGGRQVFMQLLQRFRTEFFLAHAQKIQGLDWLIIQENQLPEVEDFSRRYGLQIIRREKPC